MYAAHPALLVLALLSTSLPLIPKSHSLTTPFSSRSMFDGLTSVRTNRETSSKDGLKLDGRERGVINARGLEGIVIKYESGRERKTDKQGNKQQRKVKMEWERYR